MKKKVVLLTAFTLVALLVAGGTMAWFTANDEVSNIFKAGTVEVKVNDHGFKDVENVNPGDCYEKKLSVKSLGSKRTLVRVKFIPSWTDTSGNPINSGSNDPANIITQSIPVIGDWIKIGDWYYYKKELTEGNETSVLKQNVCFNGGKMDNDYQGATYTLKAEAEAVQATNFAPLHVWGLKLADLQQLQGYENVTEAEYSGESPEAPISE